MLTVPLRSQEIVSTHLCRILFSQGAVILNVLCSALAVSQASRRSFWCTSVAFCVPQGMVIWSVWRPALTMSPNSHEIVLVHFCRILWSPRGGDLKRLAICARHAFKLLENRPDASLLHSDSRKRWSWAKRILHPRASKTSFWYSLSHSVLPKRWWSWASNVLRSPYPKLPGDRSDASLSHSVFTKWWWSWALFVPRLPCPQIPDASLSYSVVPKGWWSWAPGFLRSLTPKVQGGCPDASLSHSLLRERWWS